MTDIICFWDASIKSWIMFAVDAEGNQLWDAQYMPNRHALRWCLLHA